MCAFFRSTNIKVASVNISVLGQVVILLGHQDTLLEEVLVYRLAVCTGDEHGCGWQGEGKVRR